MDVAWAREDRYRAGGRQPVFSPWGEGKPVLPPWGEGKPVLSPWGEEKLVPRNEYDPLMQHRSGMMELVRWCHWLCQWHLRTSGRGQQRWDAAQGNAEKEERMLTASQT